MAGEPKREWVQQLNVSSYDDGRGITTGSDGSIYITGEIFGYLDGKSSNSFDDIFFAKYNSDGTKAWTQLLGSSNVDRGNGITTGSDGSIYITGVTNGNLDGKSNSGSVDIFIAKYNSDGTKAWTQLLGSPSDDQANGITTGSDGSIYITGYTFGNLDGKSNSGNSDIFIAKYNSDGTKAWTQLLGSPSVDHSDDQANGITTGSDGSIYITGVTYGNLDGKRSNGVTDIFIAKYNSDGGKLWTQLLGSSNFDRGNGITTGSDGSIYITGYTFGNLDGKSYSGNVDIFIAKYNSDGTKAWTQLLGSPSADQANGITTGSDGSIYITGYTGGNLDGKSNSGISDIFIAKYNSDGTKAWTQLLGSPSADQANGITTGSDGSIYITGYTFGNLDGKSNSGNSDIFIAKYSEIEISNSSPTALNLSSTSFDENITAGSAVATLSSTDPDSGDSFTYALIVGSGDSDNSAFTIDGNQLKIKASPDFESKSSYSIRLQTKDSGGLILEKAVTLNVRDQDEVAPNITISSTKTSLLADEQATLIFILSEDSTDFEQSDISVFGGGTLSNFLGSGKNYKVDFTPKPNSTTASVISVSSNTFSDAAGNFNNDGIESNNKVTLLIDTVVTPGVKVSLPSDLITDENGKTVEIPLLLKTQPSAPVRLDFVLSKGAEATLNQSFVEFSISNWATPQTLKVTGAEDYVDDPDQQYTLTITGTSTDKSYKTSTDPKSLQIPVINLVNLDDGEDEGKSIYGDAGAQPIKDNLKGTEGPDRIYGLLEDDALYGRPGNDLLFGGYGNDLIYGEAGNDELYGQEENDTLYGGEGDDRLTGGEGYDRLIGGPGNDTYVIDDERDVIDDQGTDKDVDTVLFRANLNTYTLPASIKNGVLDSGSAYKLIGNARDNELRGNDNANEIDGGDGNDALNGGGGNDILKGGSGNDTAYYGARLSGYMLDSVGGASIKANLLTGVATGDEIGTDTLIAIENLETADGADTLIGNAESNRLIGNGGNDTILGGDGDDVLIGDQGNDSLDGGNGTQDQAIWSGKYADYKISYQVSSGALLIADQRNFQDGTDVVTGVELFKFADTTVSLIQLRSGDTASYGLDLDGDNQVTRDDSLLLMRSLLGTYPGDKLISGLTGSGAVKADTARQRFRQISSSPNALFGGRSILDLDGDNKIHPLTDGLLVGHYIHNQGFSDRTLNSDLIKNSGRDVGELHRQLQAVVGF